MYIYIYTYTFEVARRDFGKGSCLLVRMRSGNDLVIGDQLCNTHWSSLSRQARTQADCVVSSSFDLRRSTLTRSESRPRARVC